MTSPDYKMRDLVIYIPEQLVYKFGYYSRHEGICTIFWDGPDYLVDGSANEEKTFSMIAVKLIDIRPVGINI